MSAINHKKPGFTPLNTRKPETKTVGQTHGERRALIKEAETEKALSRVQRVIDRFFGGKKLNDIHQFGNKNDRFASPNPIVEQKNRLEAGTRIQSRAVQPSGDQYIRFLDSVIDIVKKKIT